MSAVCLILFLVAVALWFFTNEYPVLFGIYVPTCALKRSHFKITAAVFLLFAVYVGCVQELDTQIFSISSSVDCQSFLSVLISSLIVLLVLKLFDVSGSVVYSFLGAMYAYNVSAGYKAEYEVLLSLVAAPFMCFLLSAFLRGVALKTLDKSHTHLITLSYYIRHIVIACIILSAFSVGLNWGSFLDIGAAMLAGNHGEIWMIMLILAASMLFMSVIMRDRSNENVSRYSDFSAYTILSIGISVAATLLFFSFDSTTSLLSLKAVPLSIGSLVFSAIAGVETVKRSRLIVSEEYLKEIVAFVAAPLGSYAVAFLIFYLSGGSDEHLLNFTVMSAAILMLVALAFAGYVRRQKAAKLATERLVYSQQQQIYENARALNDMEMKVVLSENQALHNSIEMKKQEVRNVALSMVEQKEYLESLNSIVKQLSKTRDDQERDMLIAELKVSLRQRLSYDRDVDSQYFAAQAENIHEDFNAKLLENFPDLTQQETRLATLLRLGFSSKYIATLLNITPKSVEISRYRLRQKLGLSKGDNLVNFIKSI